MSAPSAAWAEWAQRRLDGIRSAGRWREVRSLDAFGPVGTLSTDGREVVSFASNDYLGLTAHPAVIGAAHAALDRWGAGAGAARLVTGARPVHGELEEELAAWKGAERAVLFPTGFAANLGVLATFGDADARILSDERNHASIIDGCRLARAETQVYGHADVVGLDRLLAAATSDHRRPIVVTDTVFSMDGDRAPVEDIVDRCREHRALLVLDEAHAVLGPELDASSLEGVDVLRVGTLSKTLGALGGFVAASRSFAEVLVNSARPYIFTTASTPADTAAALAGLRVLRSGEGEALRARLRHHVDELMPGHPSPIVPIVLGDERRTVAAAAALAEHGLLVPAIRPPTVPPGTSRLRVTVSATHTDAQVAVLIDGLAELGCGAEASRTDGG